jgi:hypothetical protein
MLYREKSGNPVAAAGLPRSWKFELSKISLRCDTRGHNSKTRLSEIFAVRINLFIDWNSFSYSEQGCHIFRCTKIGGKLLLNYQMALNIPNGLKIPKGRNIFQWQYRIYQPFPIQGPPKFTQSGISGLKTMNAIWQPWNGLRRATYRPKRCVSGLFAAMPKWSCLSNFNIF